MRGGVGVRGGTKGFGRKGVGVGGVGGGGGRNCSADGVNVQKGNPTGLKVTGG